MLFFCRYGDRDVDCVLSSFHPLEWTVNEERSKISCFAKVVINTAKDDEVLGIHVAAPNAGEIMQGLAVAFRKGLHFSVDPLHCSYDDVVNNRI